jgi:hypothetical protein
MSRPPKSIDSTQVAKLAALGATHEEIAHFFGVDRSTIERRFCTEIESGRAQQKIKLRRLQWRAAEKGNVVMLIWLGKNILGQSDEPKDAGIERKVINFIVHHPDEIQKVPCVCDRGRNDQGEACELCLGTGVKEIRYGKSGQEEDDSHKQAYFPSDTGGRVN